MPNIVAGLFSKLGKKEKNKIYKMQQKLPNNLHSNNNEVIYNVNKDLMHKEILFGKKNI